MTSELFSCAVPLPYCSRGIYYSIRRFMCHSSVYQSNRNPRHTFVVRCNTKNLFVTKRRKEQSFLSFFSAIILLKKGQQDFSMYKYVGHGYSRRFGLFPAFISVSPCIRMREGFLGVCGPIQDIAVVTCSDVPPVQVYAVLREQGLVAPMYKGFYHEKSALRWAGVVYTYPVCKPGVLKEELCFRLYSQVILGKLF